ncbi:MAG: ADP-ribosyl-[dinitrogen reductase] hydrolase [Zoogloeaceae bacterium]|jgi:ADP-ribosyl-[dinitrogen reductase] hydrolase|nr:ADP-ribosyl-[dinitrogen reductase] hydrolase [Zoogloeaceae bacterium]
MPIALPPKNECADRSERAKGAYLGLAVGDALGATVEFLTPGEIRHKFANRFANHDGKHKDIIGGGWLNLKAGQITDDTAMSLALGEAILMNGGKVDALASAHAFDNWMRSKPIDIGNTVRRNLIHFRQTGIPAAPASEHDAGNGAVMRLLPVALATLDYDAIDIAAAFKAQAHVTHNNPLSDAGGICLINMLHIALQSGTWIALKAAAKALESQNPEYAWSKTKKQENPSGYVAHTLQAVFQAFFATDSFESCLINVVNRGGDADTTGAIAGMLAGAWYGEHQIPPRWKIALDKTIARRCEEQADALLACSTSAARNPQDEPRCIAPPVKASVQAGSQSRFSPDPYGQSAP